MATQTRTQRMQVVTPKGTAGFCFLDRPSTKFDPDGQYQVDIILEPGPSLESFQAELTKFGEEARRNLDLGTDVPISLPIVEPKDADKKATGKMAIRCRQKASVQPRDGGPPLQFRVTVVDAKTNPIVPCPKVGAGSEVIAACDALANFVQGKLYVSLKPRVVQILQLIEYGQASPSMYGLQSQDGWEAPAPTAVDESTEEKSIDTDTDGPDY